MITLDSDVSKCLSCKWVGDSWDIFCPVDKSHETARAWAWINKPTENYDTWAYVYSSSPSDPNAKLISSRKKG